MPFFWVNRLKWKPGTVRANDQKFSPLVSKKEFLPNRPGNDIAKNLGSLRSQLIGMMECWKNGMMGWRPSGK
jgi:hypothetical protein